MVQSLEPKSACAAEGKNSRPENDTASAITGLVQGVSQFVSTQNSLMATIYNNIAYYHFGADTTTARLNQLPLITTVAFLSIRTKLIRTAYFFTRYIWSLDLCPLVEHAISLLSENSPQWVQKMNFVEIRKMVENVGVMSFYDASTFVCCLNDEDLNASLLVRANHLIEALVPLMYSRGDWV
ncbi:hypothetical protein VNO77_23555 [Canavalia gladiata]|uniref:Uncharacterized protein n=1 Tax=Canavalia gladiata TaxID=3824 RepID=A0AAN9QBY4_CANGL